MTEILNMGIWIWIRFLMLVWLFVIGFAMGLLFRIWDDNDR